MQVYLIDRPGLTQASVALGEVGISQTDPDHYALEILNDILNSFGGKLFDQIRSREVRPLGGRALGIGRLGFGALQFLRWIFQALWNISLSKSAVPYRL